MGNALREFSVLLREVHSSYVVLEDILLSYSVSRMLRDEQIAFLAHLS